VERARYEADRAERAFHAAEPENRLVVRTLEARWEAKLAALADADAALIAAQAAAPPLPPPLRNQTSGCRVTARAAKAGSVVDCGPDNGCH